MTTLTHNKKYITALALLAMALSLLATITPLWAKNNAGTSILICTAFGSKTITIDKNGNELPDLPQIPAHAKNNCALCLAASALATLPPRSAHFALKTDQSRASAVFTLAQNPITSPQSNANAIRAPPSLS